jgi:hypothetical protein
LQEAPFVFSLIRLLLARKTTIHTQRMLQCPYVGCSLYRSCISTKCNSRAFWVNRYRQLIHSIPIVECRNAEDPFVRFKKRERERKQKSRAQLNTLHYHISCCAEEKNLKRIVGEHNPNTCVETHTPFVKCIPHEYRFSKGTVYKPKGLCRKVFYFFL